MAEQELAGQTKGYECPEEGHQDAQRPKAPLL